MQWRKRIQRNRHALSDVKNVFIFQAIRRTLLLFSVAVEVEQTNSRKGLH
jgi:hypothetical protein